ncbi:MAG: hypothetical protein JOY71_30450 [Acetobacteraceae bacterium]|nr:hypothetical protein [Acetobacteraceae bacterium]MBV8526385.1 hypothetical protein [Acetobacteraceae bacterium]MBV8591292.1 hypothetical protein [Acetobacteraceae bacterium]
MPIAGSFTVSSDHPSLPGHFPGRPVVPGAVLLDEALSLIGAALDLGAPCEIGLAKFIEPVLAGQTILVSYSVEPSGRARFAGTHEQRTVLLGVARFASPLEPL